MFLSLCALGIVGVASRQFDLASNYTAVQGHISRLGQTCADGRNGKIVYLPCNAALPQADRRTIYTVSYVSPVDQISHDADFSCDTEAEKTPKLNVGDVSEVLAHKQDATKAAMQKCTAVAHS